VVAKPDSTVTEAGTELFLTGYDKKGIISKYGVPDRIVNADSLPRTSVGKLDKKVLRGLYNKKTVTLLEVCQP